ncbi:MAG: KpsF/GutQ family sugar-phosphate isomerase [Paludibacteraceae bacterium]|nr:KpsF/GutQ family sugar-phosphate isomerase [Paludibacteraceae bacterium]
MSYSENAKQIFESEIKELLLLSTKIDSSFDRVVEAVLSCKGKLVLMGIGKTGIIAHKIASSLASTGTPAIFVNAAEAVHGDLGMVGSDDIVMLVSNSGATNEILNVIAPLRNIGCQLIALTGNPQSPLAKDSDLVLSTHIEHEACPLGLAPTTSTTATLMMGDALMVCLMQQRQFRAENFAVYHPGGALGRQLLGRVKNRMTTDIPRVETNALFKQLVKTMSEGHLGMTLVYRSGKCEGIITDGDIRRAIQKYDSFNSLKAEDIMTRHFKSIEQDALLTEALAVMDRHNITTLAVKADKKDDTDIVGIISIHHIIDFN